MLNSILSLFFAVRGLKVINLCLPIVVTVDISTGHYKFYSLDGLSIKLLDSCEDIETAKFKWLLLKGSMEG